jgi:hypothetical protein
LGVGHHLVDPAHQDSGDWREVNQRKWNPRFILFLEGTFGRGKVVEFSPLTRSKDRSRSQ